MAHCNAKGSHHEPTLSQPWNKSKYYSNCFKQDWCPSFHFFWHWVMVSMTEEAKGREGGFLGAEFSSYFHLPDLRPWGFIRLKMRFPNFTFGRSLRQLVSRTRLNSCRAALLLIHKANEKTRKGGRALSHWGALGMQPGDVRHSHPSTQPDQAHSATAPIINMPCCKGVSSAAPLSVQVRGGGEHPNCDCWFWEPHGWKHPAATEAARKTKGHSPQGGGDGLFRSRLRRWSETAHPHPRHPPSSASTRS